MIKLTFIVNREIFRIEINNKEIYYSDRKWEKQIRLIPKDEEFLKKILKSRNKIPNFLASLFTLTQAEQEQYDKAKTDEELADICIIDSKMKGATLLKQDGNI